MDLDDHVGDSESDSCACVSVKELELESLRTRWNTMWSVRSCHQVRDVEGESMAEECSTGAHDELFSFYTRQDVKDMGVRRFDLCSVFQTRTQHVKLRSLLFQALAQQVKMTSLPHQARAGYPGSIPTGEMWTSPDGPE